MADPVLVLALNSLIDACERGDFSRVQHLCPRSESDAKIPEKTRSLLFGISKARANGTALGAVMRLLLQTAADSCLGDDLPTETMTNQKGLLPMVRRCAGIVDFLLSRMVGDGLPRIKNVRISAGATAAEMRTFLMRVNVRVRLTGATSFEKTPVFAGLLLLLSEVRRPVQNYCMPLGSRSTSSSTSSSFSPNLSRVREELAVLLENVVRKFLSVAGEELLASGTITAITADIRYDHPIRSLPPDIASAANWARRAAVVLAWRGPSSTASTSCEEAATSEEKVVTSGRNYTVETRVDKIGGRERPYKLRRGARLGGAAEVEEAKVLVKPECLRTLPHDVLRIVVAFL